MARQVFSRTHRAVLWTLTGNWRTRTLPADNLDNPVVYLLAKGLAEVVDGRLQATRAGYELRKQIEREQAATGAARVSAWSCVPGDRTSPVERRHSLGQTGLRPGRAACRCQSVRWRVISLISAEPFASGLSRHLDSVLAIAPHTDRPARTLLRVIAREPDAVSYALAGRMRRWRRGILDDRCW